MYHRVTIHLVLDPGGDVIALEFSRAVAMGEDNSVLFDVTLNSKDGAIDKVEAFLQGSNDASKWTTISTLVFGDGTTGSVSVPDYGKVEVSAAIPWALVRLKYKSSTSASKRIQLRGAIETFKRG
jgi:hypothetical protein